MKKNNIKISKLIVVFMVFALFLISHSDVKSDNQTKSNHSSVETSEREMGNFVKDINLPLLEIKIPPIYREKYSDGGEFLSLEGGFFPMQEFEIHFPIGQSPDYPPESLAMLYETWKLGGSSKYPGTKYMERWEYLGAKFSWKNDYDKSILSISYLERDEKEIMDMLVDWLFNPQFTKENLEIVRGQLKEALARRDDSVIGLGFRKTKERFYSGHLRGRSESLDSLERVGLKDIISLHKRMIGDRNVKILFSGNGKKEEASHHWKKILARFPKTTSPTVKDVDFSSLRKSFQNSSKDIYLIEKETNQSIVIYSTVMPPHNHKDFYAIQVLNYILGGGGFNSYLMTEIRNNRGLAYSTTSYVQFQKTHGMFMAYTLTKNDSISVVMDLMEEIFSFPTIDKITDFELERAKTAIVNQFVFLFENRSAILSNQVRFDEHDMPSNYLEIYRDKIQSVSLADIKRVGKEYFNPYDMRVIMVSPQSTENMLKNNGKKVRIFQPVDNFP